MTARAPMLLFATSTYAYLEPAFFSAGEFERGAIERKVFPDGEKYLRIDTDTWGRDVVLLGGTPTDLDWMEVYDLGCGIARSGARSLSIVMPYFGYATMERAVRPGEVVTAKNRARLVSAIPPCEAGTRIFLFDLHTDGVEFYFNDAHVTHHVYGAPVITKAMRALVPGGDFVVGATDAGRAKWVESLARSLGVSPAFVYKHRDGDSGTVALSGVNADVQGREVIVYDDMIRTGSSLVQAGRAYLDAGATKIHALASHLVLPGDALERIEASGVFSTIAGTDSHPGSQRLQGRPSASWSIAELLVRAIEVSDQRR